MPLESEIEAYDKARENLEREHMGKWAVFHNQELVGLFDNSSAAGIEAVRRFGRGPYLIRQIGAPPLIFPASVQFFSAHASS